LPPPGRPPAERNVFSFEGAGLFLPTDAFLDTSFVVEALVSSQRYHKASQLFMERLAEASLTIYFNRLLEVEPFEATFRIALKELHPRDWLTVRPDGRARRRANALLAQTQRAWTEVLAATAWVAIELHEVIDRVPHLMGRYGLASYDAVHVASAMYAGVRDFVTLDRGFALVPASALTLHVNSSRVSPCRQLRA
jgi:predicted nucleic acid-binding protein